MSTLQELLVARVGGDPRAQNAVVESNAGRPRILFGSVGAHGRITLSVEGNAVKVLYPTDLADPADLIAPDPIEGAPVVFELAGGGEFELRDGLIFPKDGDEALVLVSRADFEAAVADAVAAQAPAGGESTPDATDPAQPDETGAGGAQAPAVVDPKAHSRDELIAMAAAIPVSHAADATKAQIAEAINAANAAK